MNKRLSPDLLEMLEDIVVDLVVAKDSLSPSAYQKLQDLLKSLPSAKEESHEPVIH